MVFLFDLDGTLIDSQALVIRASLETLRRGAGIEVTAEEIRQTLPLTISGRFHRYAPDRVEELVSLYNSFYAAHIADARPFPEIPEVLGALRARAARCGVVTSRMHRTADLALRTHGLNVYFDVVICDEDVSAHKPAPDPVFAALAALAVGPGDAIMIGDSVLDIRAGRAAATRTGAALWGSWEPDALLAAQPDDVFTHPREILRTLEAGADGRPRS
jgi:HAD superfamily hydrolase (TIGR01549 family)